jgi:two-component system, OmpR family, alkaline phosphatase synthesis response regulator PhoP
MKKVLLIDDEQDFCYFTKKNLESSGEFTVSICGEGVKGISLIKQLKPDLVLLDIVMPGINGTDIASQMREDEELRNIPFAFLTAIIKPDEVEKSHGYIGGETIIAKPVATSDLVRTINQCIVCKKESTHA